jgi:hypothetical protein
MEKQAQHCGGFIEDDAEEVVISHPHPPGTPDRVPRHIHDGKFVICKADVREITLGPIVGYSATHKYRRTEDKDFLGRTVFTEVK